MANEWTKLSKLSTSAARMLSVQADVLGDLWTPWWTRPNRGHDLDHVLLLPWNFWGHLSEGNVLVSTQICRGKKMLNKHTSVLRVLQRDSSVFPWRCTVCTECEGIGS